MHVPRSTWSSRSPAAAAELEAAPRPPRGGCRLAEGDSLTDRRQPRPRSAVSAPPEAACGVVAAREAPELLLRPQRRRGAGSGRVAPLHRRRRRRRPPTCSTATSTAPPGPRTRPARRWHPRAEPGEPDDRRRPLSAPSALDEPGQHAARRLALRADRQLRGAPHRIRGDRRLQPGIRSGGDADLCFRLRAAGWELESRDGPLVAHHAARHARRAGAPAGPPRRRRRLAEQRYPGSFPRRALARADQVDGRDARPRGRALRGDRAAAAALAIEPLSSWAFELGRLVPNRTRARGRHELADAPSVIIRAKDEAASHRPDPGPAGRVRPARPTR